EVSGGHEFQFELLPGGAVVSAAPGKPSRRLALKFPLADIADIRTDHEPEQMLGINALGANAGWEQHGEAQDCHPERFCTDRHSHSESHWVKSRREQRGPNIQPIIIQGPAAS